MPQTLSEPRAARRTLAAYIRDISPSPLLSAAAERRLAERIGTGDSEARDRMVRANLRLVVNVARAYTGKGLPLEDLIAEGNLGLMRAAELFDPSRGHRFSTYAVYWIKQSIRRALTNTSRTVRLPSYILGVLAKWQRVASEIREELGRPAAEDEIARRLGLSGKKLKIVREAIRVSAGAVQEGALGESEPLSEVAWPTDGGPEERLAKAEQVSRALGVIGRMDARSADVLRLRFGLSGEAPMTRREVGERFGLTRERVRQIEGLALAELRARLRA
ncbi:MAG: RNA polymerase sigma factor RpoD/SigA [Gemmataceae bacterium]